MNDDKLLSDTNSIEVTTIKKMKDNVSSEVYEAFEEALMKVEEENNRKKSLAEVFLKYIQSENKKENLVVQSLILLNPPIGLDKKELTIILKNLKSYDILENITIIESSKNIYYYDNSLFTKRFATVQSLLLDKDILATIAAATRHDCKIYPRPLRMVALNRQPYNFSDDEIFGALARMKIDDKYADINTVTASNGKICIYSTTYMSEKYANALGEQLEVEWQNNQ